jgi:uncharacterized protein (TIGR03083 family)
MCRGAVERQTSKEATIQVHNHTLPIAEAAAIEPLGHDEAAATASLELERFLALVDGLAGDDWEQPTYCTKWNVRQVVAHVAGSHARFAHWSEFERQMSAAVQQPYREAGLNPLDARNQIQVDDRRDAPPADLIAELRAVVPRSIEVRHGIPDLLRAGRVRMPIGEITIGYVTDTLATRDMWMHRLEIGLATGRGMVQTAEHDGRIVALVLHELAEKLLPSLAERSVVYELSGPAGAHWRIGENPEPSAAIAMDVLDFNLLASERLTAEEARKRSLISINGDAELARHVLQQTIIPY